MATDTPILAVDCDDVLVPNFETLVRWYNATYDAQLTLADNGSDDLRIWKATSIDQAIRQVQAFFASEAFAVMQPVPRALEVLQLLQKRYDVQLFTARDHIIEAATLQWLTQHFPNIFSAVHFTAQFNLEGKARDKVDVLLAEQATYLIDDTLSTVIKAVERGVTAVLFGNYAWNQADNLPIGVTRCDDWPAVLEFFDGQS